MKNILLFIFSLQISLILAQTKQPDWTIMNSHRKDIEKIPTNFRSQTIKEVLPPDERPIQRHNANIFNLDRTKGNGTSEHSAGDIWLLPYWLGRYLGVISPPQNK